MKRLASRNDVFLYADEFNHWVESEINLDQTELSSDALRKLEKSGKARSLFCSPGMLAHEISNESAREEFEAYIEPALLRYWKAGFLT